MPARHAGLGQIYTLRRPRRSVATVTCLPTQLKAHLRGQVPLSGEQLKEVMLSVITATQEVTLVERQTNRY